MATEPTPPRPLDEILRQVIVRGRRLRRRRRIAQIGTPAIAATLIFLAITVLRAGGPPNRGITLAPVTEGTSLTPTLAESPAAPTTVSSSPTTSSPPEESSPLTCRDSFDSRCGEFYWDPPPADNQPMSISVIYEPEDPAVGEEVIFTVHVRDPDAPKFGSGCWGSGSRSTCWNVYKGF